jgi:hypothetical protein
MNYNLPTHPVSGLIQMRRTRALPTPSFEYI